MSEAVLSACSRLVVRDTLHITLGAWTKGPWFLPVLPLDLLLLYCMLPTSLAPWLPVLFSWTDLSLGCLCVNPRSNQRAAFRVCSRNVLLSSSSRRLTWTLGVWTPCPYSDLAWPWGECFSGIRRWKKHWSCNAVGFTTVRRLKWLSCR